MAFETGWQTVKALVFRPRVAELLINTLLLVVLTLPICAVLGVALAWLTERTTLPGRRLWAVLAVAPLAIPAFVQSYAWVSLVPSMHGLAAGVFLSVLAYFPFIYMPVAAVLRRLDPDVSKMSPPRSAPRRGGSFSAWCCRSSSWRSAAARCWWRCTCWRNMACT